MTGSEEEDAALAVIVSGVTPFFGSSTGAAAVNLLPIFVVGSWVGVTIVGEGAAGFAVVVTGEVSPSVFGSWTDAAVLNLLVVVTIFFDFFAGLRASGDGAGLAAVVWPVSFVVGFRPTVNLPEEGADPAAAAVVVPEAILGFSVRGSLRILSEGAGLTATAIAVLGSWAGLAVPNGLAIFVVGFWSSVGVPAEGAALVAVFLGVIISVFGSRAGAAAVLNLLAVFDVGF